MFDTKYGSYNVYGIDRSVCDFIRFREDIDKDIFELVLRTTEDTIRRMKNVSWHMPKQCVSEDR